MFVRTMIGRQAGQIIELPFHAAQQALDFGTAVKVTDAEAAAAGFTIAPTGTDAPSEQFPSGYSAHAIDGGFDIFIEGKDEPLNEHLIPNLPAARSFAIEHAANAKRPPVQEQKDRATREENAASIEIPEKWQGLSWPEQKKLAGQVSKSKITDGASVSAAIEQELAWRAEDAAAAAAGAQS